MLSTGIVRAVLQFFFLLCCSVQNMKVMFWTEQKSDIVTPMQGKGPALRCAVPGAAPGASWRYGGRRDGRYERAGR